MRIFSFLVSALYSCLVFGVLSILIADIAHADAFVCVNAQGKKVFSNEACEKKNMKVASPEFPVVAGQPIAAVVVTQAAPGVTYDAKGGMISKDGKTVTLPGQILLTSDLPLDKPVLYFLIATTLGTIGILIGFFMHYIRTRRAKMDLFRG